MSCNHPLKAFKTGYLTENGKDEYIIFEGSSDMVSLETASKKASKIAPWVDMTMINGQTFLVNPVEIPCGHCVGCRMDHAKEWKVRCCKEAEHYPPGQVHFITLTYDEEHLRRQCVLPDGSIGLNKRDLQIFFKRLRSRCGNCFRYLACGEYGAGFHRPHFHAIIFGDAFPDKFRVGYNCWKSAILSDAWQYGFTDLAEANNNTIAYVAGYVEKKQDDPDWFSYPVKPFLLMSRKPGLGYDINYIHAMDYSRLYGDFGSVHSSRLSRFYLNRMEKLDPSWREDYRLKCQEIGQIYSDIDSYWFRTSDKERIGAAKDAAIIEKLNEKRIEKL